MSEYRKAGGFSVRIKDIDRGWKKINAAITEAIEDEVNALQVGFFDTTVDGKDTNPESGDDVYGPGRGIDVVTRAFYAEYGTGGDYPQPPRPFMANAWDHNVAQYKRDMRKAVDKMLQGKSFAREVNTIGLRMAGHVRQNILDWPADNAEWTEREKGFNKGLMEQGVIGNGPAMVEYVNWRKTKRK